MGNHKKLPKNASNKLKSVDRQEIIDTLQTMKDTGMKEELFQALNDSKSDNAFRLKVLQTLSGMDHDKKEIETLVNMLEKENFAHPGGSEAIVHQMMKRKIVDILESKAKKDLHIENIDNYDQTKHAVSVMRDFLME